MMPICLFHTDNDGILSAAILKKAIPTLTCMPMGNGWKVPFWKLPKGEVVYVVDITFSPEDMNRLNNEYSLIWIDHHDLVIKEIEKAGITVNEGVRDPSMSGCMLTWKYQYPDLPIPKIIEWVNESDLGNIYTQVDHPLADDILAMGMGIRIDPKYSIPEFVVDPTPWINILTDPTIIDDLIKIGRPLHEYEKSRLATLARYVPNEKLFHGHVALCANVVGVNPSTFFDSVIDPTRHALTITYYFNGKNQWIFALRSVPDHPNPVNVAELAMMHGGGGHPGAAGFKVYHEDFPLELRF